MIKAMIVDDEPLAISIIRNYLDQHKDVQVIAECLNGFEAMKAINAEMPDLLFLDIQMPKITGFELLELLDPAPSVIFITAFNEHAVKAFEKHAVDYLLKPVSRERFDAALNKYRASHLQKTRNIDLSSLTKEASEDLDRIVVRNGTNLRIIPMDEIYYFEACDDYIRINLEKETLLKKQTMNAIEAKVDPSQFLRVHRSFIVRLSQIVKVEPLGKDTHIAILKNGAKVHLSRAGYSRLKETLNF